VEVLILQDAHHQLGRLVEDFEVFDEWRNT
jgi:hypothetical protein